MTEFLFDTHCHFDTLDDARVQIPRAYAAGVRALNVIGCDVETTTRALDVVKLVQDERNELGVEDLDIMATVGLHPHEAKFYEEQNKTLIKLIGSSSILKELPRMVLNRMGQIMRSFQLTK